MAASKVSLKLLIDKKGHKVLFAEASKDTVDFLFNILSLPLGTIVRLLKEQGMVGCLANLYKSIENLNENYIQPNQHKDTLLKPKSLNFDAKFPFLLLHDAPMARNFYKCGNRGYCVCTSYISDNPSALCPSCKTKMSTTVAYVAPPEANEATAEGGGFVKGLVTYMVMDDLVVKPMSTISSITLLNKFNVKEVGALEEKVVDLGMNEGLKLLKASLQSKTVLTSVFLQIMGV